MSSTGRSDVLFGWVAQCYNGIDLFGSRNVEFPFNFWIVVKGVDGKSDQAAAEAHSLRPQKDVLGGQQSIILRTTGTRFSTDQIHQPLGEPGNQPLHKPWLCGLSPNETRLFESSGRILKEPYSLGPGSGFCAQFADPNGNVLEVYSESPPEGEA